MTATQDTARRSPLQPATIWVGIAVGVAVGVGIAVSRRKRNPWETATNRMLEHSGDFAEATRELAGRVINIYNESCKAIEGATHLWANGRKLVGH